MTTRPDPTESLVERARRLDREIAAAGGLAAYWKRNAAPQYERLIDPETSEVVAEREILRAARGES